MRTQGSIMKILGSQRCIANLLFKLKTRTENHAWIMKRSNNNGMYGKKMMRRNEISN